MLPVARSSRICLFCIQNSSKPRFYASGAVPTRSRVKNLTALNAEQPTNPTNDDTPKPTKKRSSYKSRIESFLEDLDASPKTPTLEDVYDMKPGTSIGPGSPNYGQDYDAALKRVMRAFRGPQLVALANLSGYNDKLPQTQREIAQILLEKSWGWLPPHIVEEQKTKEQAEVLTKEIPVAPSLVLLLLSEDVNAISELGRRFELGVVLQTVDGTVFQIQGSQEGILALENYLNLRQRDVLAEAMAVHGPAIPTSILRLAGRQSQTYIELSPDGNQLGLVGFTEDAIRKAKRMIQRYIYKSLLESCIPMLWYLSSQHSEGSPVVASDYAFMPFHPIKSPNWFLSSRKTFRVKQVMKWLEESDVVPIKSLADGAFLDSNASTAELGQAFPLLGTAPKVGYTRSYIASVGHTVFSSETSNLTILLRGRWPLQTAIDRIRDAKLLPHFLPSLPSPLLSSPPSSIVTVHRAVYRRTPNASSSPDQSKTPPALYDVFLLEVAMEHSIASPELDDLDEVDVPTETIAINPLEGSTRCRVGFEACLDILLPERPMDVRVTVRDLQPVIEEQEPEVLKTYLQELLRFLNFTIDQQPSTPESIEYNGIQYYLDTSSSVRRTEEHFSPQTSYWESAQDAEPGIEAISETSLDLESKEKTSECLIRTNECATEEDFKRFMARCATITSMPFVSLAQVSKEPRVPYFSE